MKMNTLPVETAVEWITAWTNLKWPVSWEAACTFRGGRLHPPTGVSS